jgi:two-component system OmpR family response regulator
VLVVDDDVNIADLLTTELRFVGFAVRSANTGADALAVAAEFRPHLLVLDVMLPDVDGLDLCRQFRRDREQVGVVLGLTSEHSERTVNAEQAKRCPERSEGVR